MSHALTEGELEDVEAAYRRSKDTSCSSALCGMRSCDCHEYFLQVAADCIPKLVGEIRRQRAALAGLRPTDERTCVCGRKVTE